MRRRVPGALYFVATGLAAASTLAVASALAVAPDLALAPALAIASVFATFFLAFFLAFWAFVVDAILSVVAGLGFMAAVSDFPTAAVEPFAGAAGGVAIGAGAGAAAEVV